VSGSAGACIVAIDQGTTATKAHRLFLDGRFETFAAIEHRQIYPKPGWVEHDAEELLANVRTCLGGAPDAAAIGLANQGETVVAWDSGTGRPIHNAVVWQDARTQATIDRLKAQGAEALTLERAGLPLDPYFSATKLRWLIDHADGAGDLLKRGRLRLGTSDSFFLDRLTGAFATDVTTASRTSLMNLATRQWDPELCALFDVPIEALPEIRPTAGDFAALRLSGRELPMSASVVDQQAALFGHGCRRPGDAKITFGTGAFALTVVGAAPRRDAASGLLPTIAWQTPDATDYAVDGGVYNAASAVNWARQLGLFRDFAEIGSFDGEPAIARGLVFVPALSGLACPHWDRRAAGLWLGMGLETTRLDLVRAVLEGVALRSAEVLAAMDKLVPLGAAVSIDGGLSRNGYFCSFLAAVLGRQVVVPSSAELTGLGTAQLALIGAGKARMDSMPPAPPPARRIEPAMPLSSELHARFAEAVRRARNWR
jgi:glycerol kinase